MENLSFWNMGIFPNTISLILLNPSHSLPLQISEPCQEKQQKTSSDNY